VLTSQTNRRCFDELQELLAKVHFHIDTDILCLAGDFCNKGPHSAAVVRFARETGALAVVGNHELLSLRALATMQREGDARQLSESKYAWTRELSAQDIEYMRSLPFTIRLPLHNALVVHAGLTPGRALGKQELISLVTTRTLVRNSGARARWHASTDTSKGVPWASMWRGPEHVYFGHTTRKEVLQTPFATGLDTGCVYGGSLTAAVLEPPAAGDARHCSECGQELVTIKCSNQHKCKVGACSNKHPCKRSDARCPRPGCSTQPLAPRRTLVAVKAAQAYDSNVPWKQPSRAAKTSECQPGAPAPPAKAPLRSAASGNADGSNGRLAAPPAARSAGMTRQVPQGVEARLRALLSETGPLVQSRFLDAWSARYPDAPFDYSAWGFGRLTSALEAMPSAALLARPQGSRTDTVFPADYGIATDQAEAQDVMRNALGAIVAREASADQAAVAAFLAQPALRFTIDCLVSEYLKYQEQDKRREPPATSRDQRASPEAAEEQAP
jgi:bis(5'-nucleosyl)-tetraphosphatase (symmetrical)